MGQVDHSTCSDRVQQLLRPEVRFSGRSWRSPDGKQLKRYVQITVPRAAIPGGHVLAEDNVTLTDAEHIAELLRRLPERYAEIARDRGVKNPPDLDWDHVRERLEHERERLASIGVPKPGAAADSGGDPILVCIADVEREEVGWLWRPYVPLGKLTLLEGDPGVGKTWVALAISAMVSRGGRFPDPDCQGQLGEACPPGNVLYLSCEDGLGDTIRPRLEACSADLTRVYILVGQKGPGEGDEQRQMPIWLSNTSTLRKALAEVRPTLVVVDPLQGFLGPEVDFYRANEVRPILAGLNKLAEECRTSILLVRHLGKAPTDRAIYRGLGSIDFAASARSVLLVGREPRNPRASVLCQVKNSFAQIAPSLRFQVSDQGVCWGEVINVTAADVLGREVSADEEDAVTAARDFLAEILAEGPMLSSDVFEAARAAGIALPTLRRAKRAAGVRACKARGEGKKAPWYWELDLWTTEP